MCEIHQVNDGFVILVGQCNRGDLWFHWMLRSFLILEEGAANVVIKTITAETFRMATGH